jgi:hypothetical protein
VLATLKTACYSSRLTRCKQTQAGRKRDLVRAELSRLIGLMFAAMVAAKIKSKTACSLKRFALQ